MKIVLGSNASVASLTMFLEFCKPAQKCSMYQVIKKNITLDIIIWHEKAIFAMFIELAMWNPTERKSYIPLYVHKY